LPVVRLEEGREKDLPMCGLFLAIGECPGRSKRVRHTRARAQSVGK